jgi:hypothetical protein
MKTSNGKKLKRQGHEIFASGFFHESSSTQSSEITLGSFRVLSKFEEIFASEGAPPVSTTPAANFATGTACTVENLLALSLEIILNVLKGDKDLHAEESEYENEEEEKEKERDDGLHAGQQGHHQVTQARPVPAPSNILTTTFNQ